MRDEQTPKDVCGEATTYDISLVFHSVGVWVCVCGGGGGEVGNEGRQFMLRTTAVKDFNRFGARTQGLDVQVIAEEPTGGRHKYVSEGPAKIRLNKNIHRYLNTVKFPK